MTDASSDSDDGGAGRAQDWEVVSLSALSMSGSSGAAAGATGACSCAACSSSPPAGVNVDARTGGVARSPDLSEHGGPPAALLSNHFGVAGADSILLDRYLGGGGGGGSRADEEFRRNPSNGCGVKGEQVEAGEGSASKAGDRADTDWIEPAAPAAGQLMREESQSGSHSSGAGDDAAREEQPPPPPQSLRADGEARDAAGPLLGSCVSAPAAGGKIVSSAAAFRAGLGDDVVQSSKAGGEGAMGASACAAEEELAGLEREILGSEESGFGSFREEPRVEMKELAMEARHRRPGDLSDLTGALLAGAGEEEDDDDEDDHASCEVWWKRRVALWFMEAPQANTIWSLALAAAVMGLVILGQRWQQERMKSSFLRSQLGSRDEKISQLIYQVARLKDALSGRRRVPVLRTTPAYAAVHSRF